MHSNIVSYAVLIAGIGAGYTHGHSIPELSPHLKQMLKRAGTISYLGCGSFPDVERGVKEAMTISNTATSTLQGQNPFQDNNPFIQSWEAIRLAIFGKEGITTQTAVISMYNQIGSTGSGVTIHCGEPAQAVKLGAARCIPFTDNNSPYLDAYQLPLDNSNPNDQEYVDDKALGFVDGQNIVLCPETLPGGKRGFDLLANLKPAAGDDIEKFKSSYASMFTHEFSHLYGTKDFKKVYGYGFRAAVRIAADTAAGTNAVDSDAGEKPTPGKNADSFAFFALAVSQISTPTLESFDWVQGNAMVKVGPATES